MSENGLDFLSLLEAEQKSASARNLNGELDRDFVTGFEKSLFELIDFSSQNIPAVAIHEMVGRTGPQGVLPPPEKRFAAIEVFSGREPTVSRESIEQVQISDAERPIDLVTLHFITEVDATSMANSEEAKNLSALLNWFGRELGNRDQLITAGGEGNAPIRIKKFAGALHLIRRSVIGNIGYQEIALADKASLDAAANAHTNSLREVFDGQALDAVGDDYLTHQILTRQILGRIGQSSGRGRLSLPIFVSPKYHTAYPEGRKGLESFTPPYATDNLASVVVNPGKEPITGVFKKGTGYVPLEGLK